MKTAPTAAKRRILLVDDHPFMRAGLAQLIDRQADMMVCGEAGSLMALLCQPAEFQGSVRLPDGLGVWGIDSAIRHAVTGAGSE